VLKWVLSASVTISFGLLVEALVSLIITAEIWLEEVVESDDMMSLILTTTFELDFVLCFEFDDMYIGISLFVFLVVLLSVVPRCVGIFFTYGDFAKGGLPILSLLFITYFGRY